MKLGQITDKAIDENEVESENILDFREKLVRKINLDSLAINSSQILHCHIYSNHFLILSNKKVFAIERTEIKNHYLIISEDEFRIKETAPPRNENFLPSSKQYLFNYVLCFYDDSIFIFKQSLLVTQAAGGQYFYLKRYFIMQDKWIELTPFSIKCIVSCIGYKQKIIYTALVPGILVYDIILDSYSQFCSHIFDANIKILIKHAGKLYLISPKLPSRIYSCDGALSMWTFLFESSCALWNLSCSYQSYKVYYQDSIYYVSGSSLYQFDLKKLQSQKIYFYDKE